MNENTENNNVIVSFLYDKSVLTGSFYNPQQEIIYIIPPIYITNSNSLDIEININISKLLLQINPSIIILSTKNKDLLNISHNNYNNQYDIQIRPLIDYHYKTCYNLLLRKYNHIGIHMDLLNKGSISCCGSIINYYNNNLIINSLQTYKLNDKLTVDNDTLKTLSIFDTKNNLFNLLNQTKTHQGKLLLKNWFMNPLNDSEILNLRYTTIEILSQNDNYMKITNILKHLKNIQPIIKKLKENLSLNDYHNLFIYSFYIIKLKPIIIEIIDTNPNKINKLSIFYKLYNELNFDTFQEIGSKINYMIDFKNSNLQNKIIINSNVNKELDLLKTNYLNLDHTLSLVTQNLYLNEINLFQDLNVIYYPQLGFLITVPFNTKILNYFNLHQNDNKNNDQDSHEENESDEYLDEDEKELMNNENIRELKYQFCTKNNIYFKNDKMMELDDSIGDIHSIICDKELKIIQDLKNDILIHVKQLLISINLISELDCLNSFTINAINNNYIKPIINDDENIDDLLLIENGRHPIYEIIYSNDNNNIFIPNDCLLKSGFNTDNNIPTLLLLTGANSSGKSVYLNQIALIIYMAQIGSYVPATKFKFNLLDLLIIKSNNSFESVSRNQSSFLLNLNQIGLSINLSTKKSLIIIDEFGQNTNYLDSIGLICSIINEFLSKGNNCCKFLLSTHYYEIFEKGLLNKIIYQSYKTIFNDNDNNLNIDNNINYQKVKSMISVCSTSIIQNNNKRKFINNNYDDESNDEENKIIPNQTSNIIFLYKIIQGKTNSSWGYNCALMSGISKDIIIRSKNIINSLIKSSYNNEDDNNENIIKPNKLISRLLYDYHNNYNKLSINIKFNLNHYNNYSKTKYDNYLIELLNHNNLIYNLILNFYLNQYDINDNQYENEEQCEESEINNKDWKSLLLNKNNYAYSKTDTFSTNDLLDIINHNHNHNNVNSDNNVNNNVNKEIDLNKINELILKLIHMIEVPIYNYKSNDNMINSNHNLNSIKENNV